MTCLREQGYHAVVKPKSETVDVAMTCLREQGYHAVVKPNSETVDVAVAQSGILEVVSRNPSLYSIGIPTVVI